MPDNYVQTKPQSFPQNFPESYPESYPENYPESYQHQNEDVHNQRVEAQLQSLYSEMY